MSEPRLRLLFAGTIVALAMIVLRLFYWQVIAAPALQEDARNQHFVTFEIPAQRGEIRTSDGFPLATNKKTFLIFAYTPQFEIAKLDVAARVIPILSPLLAQEASPGALTNTEEEEEKARQLLTEKLTREDILWIPLVRNASQPQKDEIQKLAIKGLGDETSYSRDYPEASMAATLLGFVGNDSAGNPKGYFGLEGYYDLELKGRPGVVKQEKDATGKPILIGSYDEVEKRDGRDLILNIDRAVQKISEDALLEGLKKYGAASGEVVIMNPKDGAVIAMASLPSYDPARFRQFEESQYKNPVISETYEPGSTFKVLVMAAALETHAVTPETKCTQCDGPLKIGGYTVRTWNNEYFGEPTMREVIEHSDNTGMVFVARKLGVSNLLDFLTAFGIGEKTGIDLEEESAQPIRKEEDWKEIDLATASFGQGIAVTAMQMVRAVSAIANEGVLMVPRVVRRVEGEKTLEIEPKVSRRVISQETAHQMTEMMVNAVEQGEAKWAKPKGMTIAGKTGTAQIPVQGHYDNEKTIASFVGFAPIDNPKFVMLVKLREPQTSPWGSETAAPLWFSIAKRLFYYYSLPLGNE